MKKAARPAKTTTKPVAHEVSPRAPVAASRAERSEKKAGPPKKFGQRPDLGAPVDGFFAKQPPHLRPILDELRRLVEEAAPDAVSAIKWGMPFYKVNGQMMCALAGFKAHVNLILSGPPGSFGELDEILEGGGKTGRHLKLRSLDDLPRAKVRDWLRASARLARKQKQVPAGGPAAA